MKDVINVSNRHLEYSEEAVLNKFLNFATIIKRIPYLNIIAPIDAIVIKGTESWRIWNKVESETDSGESETSQTKHYYGRRTRSLNTEEW